MKITENESGGVKDPRPNGGRQRGGLGVLLRGDIEVRLALGYEKRKPAKVGRLLSQVQAK